MDSLEVVLTQYSRPDAGSRSSHHASRAVVASDTWPAAGAPSLGGVAATMAGCVHEVSRVRELRKYALPETWSCFSTQASSVEVVATGTGGVTAATRCAASNVASTRRLCGAHRGSDSLLVSRAYACVYEVLLVTTTILVRSSRLS